MFWVSNKFGQDVLLIDQAPAGKYYISVYTTFATSAKYTLTVSSVNEKVIKSELIKKVEETKNKYVFNDFFYIWKQDYATSKEYICCEKRKKERVNCPAKLKHYTKENVWVSIGQHCHAPPGLVQPTALLHPDRYSELVNWIKSNPQENHYDTILSQLNGTLSPELKHNPKYVITVDHVRKAKRNTYTKRLNNLQELYTRPDLAFTEDG